MTDINTVMQNVEKWSNILLKSCGTPQDFSSVFGYFPILCKKTHTDIHPRNIKIAGLNSYSG